MERMGQVLTLKPGTIEEYKRLHREVWPSVLQMIADCNIHNYSIFLKEPENLLFAYWEYHGTDFAADMEKMAAVGRDPALVGHLRAVAAASADPQGRRMVGADGGGVLHRLGRFRGFVRAVCRPGPRAIRRRRWRAASPAA